MEELLVQKINNWKKNKKWEILISIIYKKIIIIVSKINKHIR